MTTARGGDAPAFLLALAVCAGGVTLAVVEGFAHLLVWRRRRARRSALWRAINDLAGHEIAPDFDVRPIR